ncbi:hypothetical protein MSG28_010847 [Choristoneura fumiferana]|nr:hypothetical protein MSG28_010847 [Choristoneura fumiferana]
MLKEFEERRGDREVENLFSILEKLTEIKDTQVDKIKKGSETALPVLNEKLDQALQLCEEVEKNYLKVQQDYEIPDNISKFLKVQTKVIKDKLKLKNDNAVHQLNETEVSNLHKIKAAVEKLEPKQPEAVVEKAADSEIEEIDDLLKDALDEDDSEKTNEELKPETTEAKEDTSAEEVTKEKREDPYLLTSDLDWLYVYLNNIRTTEKDTPYLHELMEGIEIVMPENSVIKRNPVLEARCVKLRSQQEARDYRKMTKGVDNVRIRFPDDSIAFQLKQMNRQLIAIGQFIISIFAGFLFGFRGVEWMVGNLDFGFRLLLGVMCALVIALAEIYFLAKKLNEELSVPETVQLGGPPKFVDDKTYDYDKKKIKVGGKEHQD